MFDDKKILSECDSDLYFVSTLFHLIDDSFGLNHPMRTNADLCSAWSGLLHMVDSTLFSSYGDICDCCVIFVSD